jgi:hypothetical protein
MKLILKRTWLVHRQLILTCLISAILISSFSIGYAGEKSPFEKTRVSLVKSLKIAYVDNAYTASIDHFYFKTCDSLIKKKFKLDNKPVKDILLKLFEVSNNSIDYTNINSLNIPALNNNFLLTLKRYKNGVPLNDLYIHMNLFLSKILASVFEGYSVGDSIKNINGLRELYVEPYFISSRIELAPYLPNRDTLLYLLANVAPVILSKKINDNNAFYTALVEQSNHISVKAVSQVKADIYFEKILPFGLAIQQNSITAEDIKKLTMIPQDYYHAFAQEAVRLYTDKDPEVNNFLKQPISELNVKFGNYYFIKQINDLHESPDNVRFKVLESLPALDLYFIMLAGNYDLVADGSSALYTSSFLYVYKKFLKETEKEGLNKFFDDIGYYQFDTFLSNVSDYGLVDDLAGNLNEEKFADFLGNYLERLPNKQLADNEIILDAMTMAEILYEIRNHPGLKSNLLLRLEKIEKQAPMQDYFLYKRMYSVLKDILQDKYKYETDVSYDVLKIKRFQTHSPIVQVCFYYDDEDAVSSFNSSNATYDNKMWEKKDQGSYIILTSKMGNKMKVYMNKPNTKEGSDSAQNQMLRDIEKDGYTISSFIHRGHSYHLSQSLKKITSSAQFVFLGSCGGYKQVLKLFQLNPDVNIISTRSVGSKQINDPLLMRINADIVNNKDIEWNLLWPEFDKKFQSKLTKDLFTAYIPPNKYIGIKFMRKVFNY